MSEWKITVEKERGLVLRWHWRIERSEPGGGFRITHGWTMTKWGARHAARQVARDNRLVVGS